MARIEISSGGLGIPVMDFQSELASYISDAESIISSFKTVRNSTYSLNGGVGELQNSLSSIESRIQEEETKKLEAENVQAKVTSLIQLSERIDRQVAANVNQSQDELYSINPWLRPTPSVNDEAPWYEQAWGWLCGKGEAIVDGVKKAWEWAKDTAVKAWNGIVEFYKDHKKIIDTILIVVGAIGAIAAVVFTGGLALVPLLGALGLSTATAIAISTAVAIIAVVSTVGSSILNLVDIWAEVDNPVFNFFQKAFNIVSAVSNLTYSIGNIYNSIKHITPQEYIANNPVTTAQPQPTTVMFDDSIPVSQDNLSSERYFSQGNHHDEFTEFWDSGADGYTYSSVDNPQVEYIKAKDIEGVYLNQTEVENPSAFWNKRYSKSEYVDYVTSGKMANNPVEVTKVNDSFYYFEGDGRHRLLVAQELDIDVPVIIKGIYTK